MKYVLRTPLFGFYKSFSAFFFRSGSVYDQRRGFLLSVLLWTDAVIQMLDSLQTGGHMAGSLHGHIFHPPAW
jgi:hypothetical protein